jgi:LysM repeat protein
MAVAGVLVAAPHATAASAAQIPARTTVVAGQAHTQARVMAPKAARPAGTLSAVTDALVVHHEPARHYTVRAGDTLSSIAQRFYGQAADWSRLYQANRSVVHNPDMIFPGDVLDVPFDLPAATATTTAHVTKHAKSTVLTTSSTLSGTLSCGGLEELWEQAGGSPAEAVMAASIAMAESSGRQFATGSVGERGYWQINPDHGSLSTYDPLGNAKAAVIISDNGRDWDPWTTFTSGAFRGRC